MADQPSWTLPTPSAPVSTPSGPSWTQQPKVLPEEVNFEPGSSTDSQEEGYNQIAGIDLKLAKQSKQYNPNLYNDTYKATTTPDVSEDDLAEMRKTDPEGAALVESQNAGPPKVDGPSWTKSVSNFGQGVDQFGRDISNLGTRVLSKINAPASTGGTIRSDADVEYAKLQDAVQRNINEQVLNNGDNIDASGFYHSPTGKNVGYGTAATLAAAPVAELASAALPEVAATGLAGAGLRVARGVIPDAAAGAVADPNNPGEGAATAVGGGALLRTAGLGAGAAVRAISKNSPEMMQQIADTSDALIQPGSGIKGAGTAEVLGRPNLTGQKTLAAGNPLLSNLLPDWIPGAKLVKKVGGALTGAEDAQAAKLLGTENAASAAGYTEAGGPKNWQQVLDQEPVFKNMNPSSYTPEMMTHFYPQLTPNGKNAVVSGMLEHAFDDAANGKQNVDLPTYSAKLQNIIDLAGNKEFPLQGEQKWTLVGLKKLVDMSASAPTLTKDQLASGISRIGASPFTGAAAIGLLDDVFPQLAHGAVGTALKASLIYNVGNRILDSKVVRNALISLAQTNAPKPVMNALKNIASDPVIANKMVAENTPTRSYGLNSKNMNMTGWEDMGGDWGPENAAPASTQATGNIKDFWKAQTMKDGSPVPQKLIDKGTVGDAIQLFGKKFRAGGAEAGTEEGHYIQTNFTSPEFQKLYKQYQAAGEDLGMRLKAGKDFHPTWKDEWGPTPSNLNTPSKYPQKADYPVEAHPWIDKWIRINDKINASNQAYLQAGSQLRSRPELKKNNFKPQLTSFDFAPMKRVD